MNVFEDLIDELKDENLLEDTILELSRRNARREAAATSGAATATLPENVDFEVMDQRTEFSDPPEAREVVSTAAPEDAEFYRKAAIDEVSSLQMVEHIVSGIEREHMKMVPAAYDDLEAKKALHRYLQLSGDRCSPDYLAAELALNNETQTWVGALARRDDNISVSNLRRFCENSRPVLSSQALIALGRFYRNAAFSEAVRSKFDFVMTRLFSRDAGEEKRRLLFHRTEMTGHIKTFYASWASLSYDSSGENSVDIAAVVGQFEAFAAKAEAAETLDALLGDDYFEKLRMFKESTCEVFFVPEVTSAAIDSNVRIGNKFVELVFAEKEKGHTDTIEQKYGYTFDQVISTAAGKTLHLLELLKARPEFTFEDEPQDEIKEQAHAPAAVSAPKDTKFLSTAGFQLWGANKWLVALTIMVAVMSLGLYVWSDSFAAQESAVVTAQKVEINDPELKQYLRTARATATTFYAVTQPEWDSLSEQQRKNILQKALTVAGGMGLSNVKLMNLKGRGVGSASKDHIELTN